jgi:hypothetical protein
MDYIRVSAMNGVMREEGSIEFSVRCRPLHHNSHEPRLSTHTVRPFRCIWEGHYLLVRSGSIAEV